MREQKLALFDRDSHNPSIHSLMAIGSDFEGSNEIIDYCVPCNPYFPTEEMFEEIEGKLRRLVRHYPSDRDLIEKRLSSFIGLPADGVVLGNGSTELISILNQHFAQAPIAMPIPTFGRWTDEPPVFGKCVEMFQMTEESNFSFSAAEFVDFCRSVDARTAVLCNPNNPTGFALGMDDVLWMLQELRELDLIVIDESFSEFSFEKAPVDLAAVLEHHPNTVFLRSLGKNLGLHGLRMGYSFMVPALATKLRSYLPYWNINAIAEAVIEMVPKYRGAYEESLLRCSRDRDYLALRLLDVPALKIYPSAANFICIRLRDGIDGKKVRDELLTKFGCFVRECGNKLGSSSQFLRIAVRPAKDSDVLVEALNKLLQ